MRNERNESLTVISIILALFFIAASVLSFILGFHNLDAYKNLLEAGISSDDKTIYICQILFFFFTGLINLSLALTIPFIMQKLTFLTITAHNIQLNQAKQNETLSKHENAIEEYGKIKCEKCQSLNLKENEYCWQCGEKLNKQKRD